MTIHTTCETCSALVKVVGNTTKHYEPLYGDEAIEALRARVAELENDNKKLRDVAEAAEPIALFGSISDGRLDVLREAFAAMPSPSGGTATEGK